MSQGAGPGQHRAGSRSRIVLPQGEAGRHQAIFVSDAVASAQGQILGEDREIGEFVRVDNLGKLGRCLAAAARGHPKIINPDKLPDFSVFAKYLTLGGSYSVADEDGLMSTGFTLRKNNP